MTAITMVETAGIEAAVAAARDAAPSAAARSPAADLALTTKSAGKTLVAPAPAPAEGSLTAKSHAHGPAHADHPRLARPPSHARNLAPSPGHAKSPRSARSLSARSQSHAKSQSHARRLRSAERAPRRPLRSSFITLAPNPDLDPTVVAADTTKAAPDLGPTLATPATTSMATATKATTEWARNATTKSDDCFTHHYHKIEKSCEGIIRLHHLTLKNDLV
jgi:hypothetical protein